MTNRARIYIAMATFAALTIAPLACTHAPSAPAANEALPLQIAPIPEVPHGYLLLGGDGGQSWSGAPGLTAEDAGLIWSISGLTTAPSPMPFEWATTTEPARRVDPADGICVESVTAFTGARIDCEHGATAALDRSVPDHPVVRCVCDNNGGRMYQMELASDVTEPIRILAFSQMLYPQESGYFARKISPKTWAWLQEQARRELATSGSSASSAVVAHWKSIVAGQVPFGFSVESR